MGKPLMRRLFRCWWGACGGMIARDEQGRINWRCDTCGEWSSNPVPLRDEAAAANREQMKDESNG